MQYPLGHCLVTGDHIYTSQQKQQSATPIPELVQELFIYRGSVIEQDDGLLALSIRARPVQLSTRWHIAILHG